MKVPHLKHLLELCSNQKTMTTARLEKELLRIEGQINHNSNKMRNKHQERVADLNKRAQRAEAMLKKQKQS